MNINDEAKKIIADNTASNETLPWPGYTVMMKNILVRRTGCTWQAAYYALSDAMMEVAKPRTLSLGDLANKILDRDDVIKDLLGLLDDLCGPDAARNETYKRGMELLAHEVN
jgi:hypothetical protein